MSDATSLLSRRWAIFIIICLLYVLSQFYRASIAVITPNLMQDLGVGTRGLSLVTSAFFYAFALTQIPIGVSLDRIGPRRTMAVLNLVGIAGAGVFASADSLDMLVAGRILLGVGMACNLMGAFKLLTTWFGPLNFATLSVMVISIGTAGNLVATTPLVLLVQQVGWRATFVIFAALNLLLCAVFFVVAGDRPASSPYGPPVSARDRGFRDIFSGLGQLFRLKDYWIISLSTFCHYGIFAAIQALWAGPFLMNVIGLSQVATGNVLLLLNLGLITSGPLWGMMSDRWLKTRKTVVIIGIAGLGLCVGVLAVLPASAALWVLALIFTGIGVLRSAGGVMYAHIKDLMPDELAGTAMTGINFFTMIGPAVFVQVMGALMQHFYPDASLSPAAFRSAFLFCTGCLAMIFALYLLTREKEKD